MLGSHGLTQTSTFKIKTNAQAFQILSSGLYSDKIAAVLREIGCNAADAHTEYGSPNKPITVKLPNRIDNQFYIKDEGPGLSHEDVMNLYTTYFDSTKRDSNDYTGAFGLGSKSPYSYVDTFSVTSVHSGVKRSYSAYLENGSPTISMLAETPADTDWPHGIQVGFPVKYEDFAQFETRAQHIYQWFKVKPIVEGAQAIRTVAPVVDHPLFGLYRGNTNNHAFGVVMGNVFYPLDLAKLNLQYSHELGSHIASFPGIILKLNIGDIQVAASREEIQYTPDSQKFLKERINEVLKYVGTEIATQLRAAKTWDEKCTVKGWSDTWGHAELTGLFTALKFPDASTLGGLAKNKQVDCPSEVGTNSQARLMNANRWHSHKAKPDAIRIVQGKTFDAKRAWATGQQVHLQLMKNTRLYYGDKNLSLIRAGEALRLGATQILFFATDLPNKKTKADAQSEAETVARKLGIDVVEDISTVPLPASYTPSIKKVKLKKGAALPPLPSVQVEGHFISKVSEKVDLSLIKPDMHSFMVRARVGGWSRRNDKIRVYEKTADVDKMYDTDDWKELWGNVSLIAKSVDAPFKGYIEISAADVSKLDLIKRGWKTTDAAVKDWLADPTTGNGIIKAAKDWRPSMQLSYRENHWAGFLVWLKHNDDAKFKPYEPHLKKVGMLKAVEQIHEQSVKQGSQAGKAEPVILMAYRSLASTYKLPAITVAKNGGYLSVEDFNNDIHNKFNMAGNMEIPTFANMMTTDPKKAVEVFQILFS